MRQGGDQARQGGQRDGEVHAERPTTILEAAAAQRSPVYRWVPLLCAASGARVAEVCQLRAEDVQESEGLWFMDFSATAGSLKNTNSDQGAPASPGH